MYCRSNFTCIFIVMYIGKDLSPIPITHIFRQIILYLSTISIHTCQCTFSMNSVTHFKNGNLKWLVILRYVRLSYLPFTYLTTHLTSITVIHIIWCNSLKHTYYAINWLRDTAIFLDTLTYVLSDAMYPSCTMLCNFIMYRPITIGFHFHDA